MPFRLRHLLAPCWALRSTRHGLLARELCDHGGSWIARDKLKIFWASKSLHSLVDTCDCRDCVHFMWLLIKDCYGRIHDLITEIDVKQLKHPKFLSQCQHVLILSWSSQLESYKYKSCNINIVWVQQVNWKDDLQSVRLMLQGQEDSHQRVCFQNFCAWDEGCELREEKVARIDRKTCTVK